jgi:hypothetical protein
MGVDDGVLSNLHQQIMVCSKDLVRTASKMEEYKVSMRHVLLFRSLIDKRPGSDFSTRATDRVQRSFVILALGVWIQVYIATWHVMWIFRVGSSCCWFKAFESCWQLALSDPIETAQRTEIRPGSLTIRVLFWGAR